MSLSKVTSANGNSLARLPAQHAAAQLFGTGLANSPAGYKAALAAKLGVSPDDITVGRGAEKPAQRPLGDRGSG
mgnify:CR=1 FL=1